MQERLTRAADRIISELENMDAGRPVLMCIDGRCASGKSTLAALLAGRLEANVVHADDFYLQPFQRTPERYAEPGGNLDRERLLAEVIRPWQEKGAFSYRPYDAHDDTFGAAIDCPHRDVTIIEGSYSTHPDLWPAYDLHVFLTVDTKTQLHRIRIRNGEEGKKEFVERWIPLEEHYFGSSNPADRCELCFET